MATINNKLPDKEGTYKFVVFTDGKYFCIRSEEYLGTMHFGIAKKFQEEVKNKK